MKTDIKHLRQDYIKEELDSNSILKNPIDQFKLWLEEAIEAKVHEPTAMNLATIENGRPTARIVLLKGITEGRFIFFTNYTSRKGENLDSNPFAALTFFWPELERQVRIEGEVSKISDSESDEYFISRPTGSKIGAWASPQSQVIENRTVLEQNVLKYKEQFGEQIQRPKFWGGYALEADKVEFWQGRANRLHDRIQFLKKETNWLIVRLAP